MKACVRGPKGLDVPGDAVLGSSRSRHIAFSIAFAVLTAVIALGTWQRGHRPTSPDEAIHSQLDPAFGQAALTFEQNQGQVSAEAKFLSRGRGHTLFLAENEAVLSIRSQQTGEQAPLRMRWEGGQPASAIDPVRQAVTRSNYYRGRDPQKWITDVPHFEAVRYRGVYPGVDLKFYSRAQEFEFDFVIEPGARADQVSLSFSGAGELSIADDGGLRLGPDGPPVQLRKPFAFQLDADGEREEVEAEFRLMAGNRVGFQLGAYDPGRELVIDPVIAFGSFLGGSSFDDIADVAVNSAGEMFFAGSTASDDFPFITNAPASRDIFVGRFAADGTTLTFMSFFTGVTDDDFDFASAIAIDAAGNSYVTGETFSDDFPDTAGLSPACTSGCAEAYVLKVGPAGALVYSALLGGNFDDQGFDIAVNSTGQAYVVGATLSTDFPTVNAFRPVYTTTPGACGEGEDCRDGFITKLAADASSILYSSYIGGLYEDEATGIALNSAGVAYVAGETQSADFVPLVTPLQGTIGGGVPDSGDDIFWIRVANNGSATYGTYFGDDADQSFPKVAIDATGNLYITAQTSSAAFPAAPTGFQTTKGTFDDGFLVKVGPNLSTILYSTYIGGDSFDFPQNIAATDDGMAYIVGGTFSDLGFPFRFALHETAGGFSDATITYVDTTATGAASLVFSTYYGNSFFSTEPGAGETATGVAVDGLGAVYIAGDTGSTGGIALGSAFQSTNAGGTDGFFAKLVPALAITPTTFDVGNFVIGSTPVANPFTIVPAVFSSFGFSSTDPGLGALPSFQFGLSGGSTNNFSIDYGPTALGAQTAVVRIDTFADSGSRQIDEDFLTFMGVGVPGTTVTPNPLTFGSVPVGSSSGLSLGVSVTTTVDVRLTSSSPTVTVPSGFTTVLSGLGPASFPVSFTPATVGPVAATITLDYFAPGDTTTVLVSDTVTVTGTGVPPFVLSSNSIDFGTVIVNDTGFGFLSLDANGNYDFAVSFSNPVFASTFGGNLGPATGLSVLATASPAAAGPLSGTMTITASLPMTTTVVQTEVVTLTGTAVNAFSLDQNMFSFGNVVNGLDSGLQTMATMTAAAPLDVTVTRTGGSDQFFTPFSTSSFQIFGGAPRDLQAFFAPAMLGASSATFTVSASLTPAGIGSRPPGRGQNGPVQTATITVDGTGVVAITANPTSFDFGTVPINVGSGAQTITTITPNTDVNLSISSDNPEFVVSTGFIPGVTAPTAITGTFTPTALGAATANITIVASITIEGELELQTIVVPVSGFGGDVFTISPPSFDFGNVVLGLDSGSRGVTTIIPATAVDLLVSSSDPNFTTAASVSVSSPTSLNALFTPGALGADAATLTLQAVPTGQTGPVLQTMTVNLAGTGVRAFTLSANPIQVMPTPVGVESDAEPLTVTPGAEIILTFTVGGGGEGDGLAIRARSQESASTVIINPPGPVTISDPSLFQVSMVPGSEGPVSQVVTVSAFTQGEGGLVLLESQTLTVNGSGFTPFTLSSTELDFGTVDVGGEATLPIVLTPFTGLDFRVGVSGGGFSASPSAFSGAAERQISVDFEPDDLGRSSQTMTIEALFRGGVAQTATVRLSGVGGNPITAGSASLGDTLFGCSASGSFTVNASTGISYDLTPSTGALQITPSRASGPGTNRFDVVFNPPSAGAFNASIAVRGSAGGASVLFDTIDVKGNAIDIQPMPTTLNFGSVDLGATSVEQIIQLTRVPASSLALTVQATSDNPDFAPVVDAQGNVSVTFTPQAAAQISGAITVVIQRASDPACQQTRVIPVSGAGGAPLVTVNPGAINFGAIAVGLTAPAQVIQLTNNSTVALNGAAAVNNGQFAITPASYSVAPGQSQTFQTTFSPSAIAAVSGAVAFDLTGPGGATTNLTASLAGQGAPQPGFTVSPGSLSYGEVVVGSTSSQTVTVSNNGDTPFDVSVATTDGAFQASPSSFTVAAMSSANVAIAFNPAAIGPLTAAANFNVVGVMQSVSLTGSGLSTDPRFEIGPEGGQGGTLPGGDFDLTRTPLDQTSNNVVEICNTGGGPGTLESLTLPDGELSIIGAPLPATLDPGECVSFTIAFNATTLGPVTGQLTALGPGVEAVYGVNAVGVVGEVTLVDLPATSAGGLNPEDIGVEIPGTEDVELTGTLFIVFDVNPAFPGVSDPNVALPMGEFVEFVKPVGTTTAQFSGLDTTMFNTGTTAGIISFSVILQLNGTDVSPLAGDIEPDETVTIPLGPPTIVSVALANRSSAGFDLVVTGFSTARQVTNLQLQFTPRAGSEVDPASLSADVNSAFVAWFNTTNFQFFGSQFVLTQRVNISGDANAIATVAVTLSNAQGTSNSVQASF